MLLTRRSSALLALIPLTAACVSTTPTRTRVDISDELRGRAGHDLAPAADAPAADLDTVALPDTVRLDDGLSADEAVAIALWNNPGYKADVASLGFAHAELAGAGVLRNPVFSLLFPWGPKQLEFTLRWPIEAIWLRPRRVEIAQLNIESLAASLVDNGLTLVSNVKTAYADLLFARKDAELAQEYAAVQRELAELTAARLRAGDIGELEADGARAIALTAQGDATRAARDAVVAKDRLAALMGIDAEAFEPSPPDELTLDPLPELDELIADALAARPDVRAAELAIEAAGKKVGLREQEIWRLTVALDANGRGTEGFEMGPGLDFEIPLFDRNQGARSAAAAELQVATHRYVAVVADVGLAVREARASFEAARETVELWEGEVLPALEDAASRTERAVELGELSYLDFVVTQRAILDASRSHAMAQADLGRARARLEKAVGRSMSPPASGGSR